MKFKNKITFIPIKENLWNDKIEVGKVFIYPNYKRLILDIKNDYCLVTPIKYKFYLQALIIIKIKQFQYWVLKLKGKQPVMCFGYNAY